MVAATFAPSVRRSIPRWFEIALWVALIFVCWLGIASINQPQVRELTDSVNWAVGRIISTLLGLAGASLTGTLAVNRFAIAGAVVFMFWTALFALALISSRRQGLGWQPEVRLRDWMELPRAAAPVVAAQAGSSAIDELNERLAAASAGAGAAAATWSVQFLIWARDVGLPRAEARLALAAAVGRGETKVWLETVRETARELESGARTRFEGSGPEVNKLALKVAAILNGVVDAEHRIVPGAKSIAQVVDLQALRIAQTLGRIDKAAASTEEKEEENAEQSGRLAS
ncbi:MAG: hypothetical protein QOI23_1453 [Chloroflexota bacterium]|nr:hypothetical protein [Chloroflexota bacterium]